jgi:hypothetical protein
MSNVEECQALHHAEQRSSLQQALLAVPNKELQPPEAFIYAWLLDATSITTIPYTEAVHAHSMMNSNADAQAVLH